ncbi:MAG: type II secretion system protein GspD [Candidatus Zipacnadales bacterium]
MQIRARVWLLIVGFTLVPLSVLAAPTEVHASTAQPAILAIESVALAQQTGCAVVQITTSAPTCIRLERPANNQLVAEFTEAVLDPQATRALEHTPPLGNALRVTQASLQPPTVRIEAQSIEGQAPIVERFADGQTLFVRLFVPPAAPLVGAAEAAPLSSMPASIERPGLPLLHEAFARWLTWSEGGQMFPLTAKPAHVAPLARTGTTGLGNSEITPEVAKNPIPTLPSAPIPEGPPGIIKQVRVVQLVPLSLAIDCSKPIEYRVAHVNSPASYRIALPGARVDSKCERSIALHPASSGHITVDETPEGALVTIPTHNGQTCVTRPGASANTILCELKDNLSGVRLADRPEPAPTPEADSLAAPEELIVNLDFQEAPLVEILTALAKYADRNIMCTSAVAGVFSVHLQDVTLEEALDVIVSLNGLEYTLIGTKNYVVGTAEEVARLKKAEEVKITRELVYKPKQTTPERIAHELRELVEPWGVTIIILEDAGSMVFTNIPDQETAERLQQLAAELDVPPVETTRWIKLEHISAAQAAAALEGLVTNVEVRMPGPEAPQTGIIGLTGKTVDVDKAEALVLLADVPAAEIVVPEAEKVVRTFTLSYVDPEQAVQVLSHMFGEQIEAYVATATEDIEDVINTEEAGGLRPATRIVVRGAEAILASVEEFLAELDEPPPQVQITATITDVRVDKDSSVGFQWDLPGLIVSEANIAGDGFKVGKIVRSPFNSTGAGAFASTFDALVQNQHATVLSRTTLIAMQGKMASVLVGDIIPYEVSVPGDGTVTRSVEFEEIGLGLKFTPTVDASQRITVFLAPQVRSFSGFSPQGYPIVATREAQTIVRVQDGDTIAIGGLLRDEELKTLSGVPFLRDIPFFGELFKKRQTQKRKSEVVVFAEIKLLGPDGRPAREAVVEG